MHDVAQEDAVSGPAFRVQHAAARGVTESGLQIKAMVDLMIGLDDIGASGFHHRQHTVGERTVVGCFAAAFFGGPMGA